jgi:hypothetical protein
MKNLINSNLKHGTSIANRKDEEKERLLGNEDKR